MDGDNNMKTLNIIILFLVGLILISSLHAAGVASPYSETIPLVMAPGQSHEFYLELQNMVGDKDLIATVNIDSGAEFVEILDENKEYSIPVGGRVNVNVKTTVPKDAKEGDYNLNFNVKMKPAEQGEGMVQLDQGVVMIIPLEVKKGAPQPVLNIGESTSTETQQTAQDKGNNGVLLVTLVVLLMVVLIIFLSRKKK